MPVIQLTEMIEVETPLGDGYAAVLETGEHDYFWTVILENGAFVTFPQEKIKAKRCYTLDRNMTDAQMKDILKQIIKENKGVR